MKFTRSIFVVLTILSVISLALARSKNKYRATANAANPSSKLVQYEAHLIIKDEHHTTNYDIKIDQDSFNQMNYGIQFSMEKGAIHNRAFFTTKANTYLFNFKSTHSFSCLNAAMFTQDSMNFNVIIEGTAYDIFFIFPNGWAFGGEVSLSSVCNKFYDRWIHTQTRRNQLENEIMQTFSHIKLLERTRNHNQNTKQGLTEQNEELRGQVQHLNSTIIEQRNNIDVINVDIDDIGEKMAEESSKLDHVNIDIRNNEVKMNQQQGFIDETSGNLQEIRQISDSEINVEWDSFKNELTKMYDLQSSSDPLRATINQYKGDVKGNADRIMKELRL